MTVDLSQFDNQWYTPGRPKWVQAFWFFAGSPLLRCAVIPFSSFRVALLRWFGARIGRGVVVKPGVRVKYPWLLSVGDRTWIGEDCWIDNLGAVTVGDDACLSQGCYLCTGNHDWSDPKFGLRIGPITVGNGAWVAARSVVGPNVKIGEGAIAGLGSTITRDVEAYQIVTGNPAQVCGTRTIRNG